MKDDVLKAINSYDGVDCICPCNVPVCPSCGHAWTHYMEFSDGQRTYTDARCVARYEALYGAGPFKAVHA